MHTNASVQCPEYVRGHISWPGWTLCSATEQRVGAEGCLQPHGTLCVVGGVCSAAPACLPVLLSFAHHAGANEDNTGKHHTPRQKVRHAAFHHTFIWDVPLICPINWSTAVLFVLHKSGSWKISVFSVPFPFMFVRVSTPLEIWPDAFKEWIQNSQRHKEAAPELTTGMLYCKLAHFPVSDCLWLSDPSHPHPTHFEYGRGNSNIATCAP